MAKKFDLDGTTIEPQAPIAPVSPETTITPDPSFSVADDSESTVNGLNLDEIKDPNSIVVSIADQAVPIIVLFALKNFQIKPS